jgi:hypothetical protein
MSITMYYLKRKSKDFLEKDFNYRRITGIFIPYMTEVSTWRVTVEIS